MVATAGMFVTVAADTLPVTKVNGKEYYYYDVKPHETIFSVSRTLGMTREQIIEANPSVADGLKAYTRLYFPVESGEVNVTAVPSGETVIHEVKKGETLYGISKQYGISVDRLIELNPAARDGIKSGQKLTVSRQPVSDKPKSAVSGLMTMPYVIRQGETLYRIAADNGITVEALLEANPDLDAFNYSAGTEINIPQTASLVVGEERRNEYVIVEEPSAESQGTKISGQPSQPVRQQVSQAVSDDTEQNKELKIAVMLPLMLSEETPSKSAELFTDFYKGLLIAADTLSDSGRPVRIYVYDTANSLDTVKTIMSRPEIKEMNLIIGPDTEEQFTYVVSVADPDNTFILNLFATKDESYRDNANVIQCNIPHAMMYDKASSAFLSKYVDYEPVFLSRVSGAADKSEFTTVLKSRLDDRGIKYREIVFREVLSAEDLSDLTPDSRYVFIPVSGTRSEFLKIVPALRQLSEASDGTENVTLFGYPEWLTFRGDLQDTLGKFNTVIYSRFYNDGTDYPTRRIADNFVRWYVQPMRQSVPSQGIFGFDAGCFVIKALRANGGDFHLKPFDYEGLQTDFRLDDSDVEGLVNTSLLLINFRPDGLVERKNI